MIYPSHKNMGFRRLYSDNYAVSHQLVSIASISIFMCVVLAAVINSVPISPDTVALSDITDKKSMALQISTILTDSPGVDSGDNPEWENCGSIDCVKVLGLNINPESGNLQSNQLRLLSLVKINKLKTFNDDYDTLKTDIFGLPSYIDFNINLRFIGDLVDYLDYPGESLDYSNLLVTKTTNVIVYNDVGTDPTWDYKYAILQVKIA